MLRKRDDLPEGLEYGQLVYKYKLDTTAEQRAALDGQIETLRRLYNNALADRMSAEEKIRAAGLKVSSERSITKRNGELLVVTDWQWRDDEARAEAKPIYDEHDLGSQKKRLITQGRKESEWLAQVNYGTCADCLGRLDKAFQAFYRRVKSGETPGFPRFKRRHEYSTIGYNVLGQGCKFIPERDRVYLHNVGDVRFHHYRPLPENASARNLSVTRQADGYWVCVLIETIAPIPAPSRRPACGIDVGYGWAFVTTSDGEVFSPKRHYRESMEKLAELQRSLDTRRKPDHRIKQSASYRWRQTMAQIQKLHLHIHRQRHEWHIEVANALVAQYGTIYHEALSIRDMVRRPAPKPGEDGQFGKTGAEATAPMRINTLDMAWGEFFAILRRQIEKQGGKTTPIEAGNSTQECSTCHRLTAKRVELADKEFVCSHCGHREDRKCNAAKTILYRGTIGAK